MESYVLWLNGRSSRERLGVFPSVAEAVAAVRDHRDERDHPPDLEDYEVEAVDPVVIARLGVFPTGPLFRPGGMAHFT